MSLTVDLIAWYASIPLTLALLWRLWHVRSPLLWFMAFWLYDLPRSCWLAVIDHWGNSVVLYRHVWQISEPLAIALLAAAGTEALAQAEKRPPSWAHYAALALPLGCSMLLWSVDGLLLVRCLVTGAVMVVLLSIWPWVHSSHTLILALYCAIDLTCHSSILQGARGVLEPGMLLMVGQCGCLMLWLLTVRPDMKQNKSHTPH